MRHVAIGQAADLIVVAPATANTIAKLAAGLADDLLGNTMLASTAPLVIAPAMHTEMWQQPGNRREHRRLARARRHDRRARRRPAHRAKIRAPVGWPSPTRSSRRPSSRRWPHRPRGHAHARDRRWHARSPRSRAIHRQSLERKAGRRDRARCSGSRRRGHAHRGEPRGRRARVDDDRAREFDRSNSRMQSPTAARDADVIIMAAAVADYRPETVAEPRSRRRRRATLSTCASSRIPTSCRPRRRSNGRPDHRRLRRRDRSG